MDLLRSLPIGLYLEKPLTWLHLLDSRVKLIWLMSLLLANRSSSPEWLLVLVGFLVVLTVVVNIPLRVWKQQMGWLLIISFLVFLIIALSPDGLAISSQPRLPINNILIPGSNSCNYVLLDKGIFLVTRRSLELGIRIGTHIFVAVYSANLYLATTTPEAITEGLDYLLSPLRFFKVPITEILLIFTLSLRFISLVLEEIQNLTRSIKTRAINWKKLGIKKSFQVWIVVIEKILENLLTRANEIATTMEIRGFISPNKHRVKWHKLYLVKGDWIALFLLFPFWYLRFVWGGV